MGLAEGFASILKRSACHRADPQCPQELEARQPRLVFLRVPFLQLGVCIDNLRILQKLVTEVIHYRRDGEIATESFVKAFLCHFSTSIAAVNSLVGCRGEACLAPTRAGLVI